MQSFPTIQWRTGVRLGTA